ncbi:MAG: urate hydroxylase PuuD [Alphaproteobacteria bacterium]
MDAIFGNLRNTVIVGIVLAILVFLIYLGIQGWGGYPFWVFLVRWLHVLSGVMWIGLLWYFNFVQTPTMPKIPAELKPGVSKFIAPEALFWFRWSAMATIITGIILAYMNDYLVAAFTLGALEGFAVPKNTGIGIGMWLGTIMWFNVWFIIWPNQKKALNIGNDYPNLDQPSRDKAAKLAGRVSRLNTMLSVPMLFSMVSAQNLY